LPLQLTAIAIFIAVFAIATLRRVHLGILMFAAACGVGVWLAKMPLSDVVGGFPVSIMVLLVGVTYFFAIAQANGTIDRMIEAALGRIGDNAVTLPFVFFAAGRSSAHSPSVRRSWTYHRSPPWGRPWLQPPPRKIVRA
jgi:energy-coupling factor transporter transmembrane protein EcfT